MVQIFDVGGRIKRVRKPATEQAAPVASTDSSWLCPQVRPPACLYPLLPVCRGHFPVHTHCPVSALELWIFFSTCEAVFRVWTPDL